MTWRERAWAVAPPAAGLLFCAVYPPEGGPRLMICPFRFLTGWPCPLCGMTRAMASLGHGQWEKAIGYHPLSPLVMAGLVVWLGWAVVRPGWRLDLSRVPNRVWLGIVLTLFGLNTLRWWGTIGSPPA
jgi:hypothetical protein